jgi:hypothetical protein
MPFDQSAQYAHRIVREEPARDAHAPRKQRRRRGGVTNVADLPEITHSRIEHFFVHDKDLEPGKSVKYDRPYEATKRFPSCRNG